MTKVRKHHPLFKLWIKLRGLLALVIVLAGLAVGLLSLLLPFESLYKDRLETFLEEQWGLQVSVQKITGSWQGYGPQFSLTDLELTGKQSIQLESANLTLNVYQMIMPGGRTGIDLSINQAELDMIHSADGASITIHAEQSDTRLSELLDRLLTAGSLRVNEMVFNVTDQSGAIILDGLEADLLLEQDQDFRALEIQIESGLSDFPTDDEQSIAIKSLVPRDQSLTTDAQWYVKFDQFELTQLKDFVTQFKLPSGQLDGELWLTAEAGEISDMTGQLSWSNPQQGLYFEVGVKQQAVAGSKDWLAILKVQNIQVNDQPLADFEVLLQRQSDISQIKTADIPIALLTTIITGMEISPAIDSAAFQQVLGKINHLEASYDDANNQWLGGYLDFSNLSVSHSQFVLQNLSGLLAFKPQGAELLLDTQNGSLTIQDIYRGTLNWQQLSAQLSINWQEKIPNIQLNNFWCDCEDFNLQLWSDIKFKDNLQMTLNSRLTAVEVAELHKYWPHNIWKEKTLNWLDQGLLGGQVETGFVFVNGDMVHQGFKNGQATFISRAYTKGVENRFQTDWPVVKDIDAVAVFNHDEIHVALQQASSMGINISQAQIDIESLDAGIIHVALAANSENNEILNYIRSSPLVKNIELDENIKIGGQQQLELAFDVAVKEELKQEFEPQGQVTFTDGQFFTEHFVIDEINGPVKLDGYQLLMTDLPAQLSTAEVLLNGKIITKSKQGAVVDVDLSGSLKADYLLDLIQQDLPISGESDWRINIKNQGQGLALTAESALAGVSIDLPAPLNKLAEDNKSLQIKCNIPCANSTVEINYNDEIKSTVNTQAGQYHLTRLQFMKSLQDQSAAAGTAELFGGYIDQLDLDQWLKLIAADNGADESNQTDQKAAWPVNEIKLNIKQLIFMSRAFTNIELQIKRLPGSYILAINSEAIKGQVTIDDNLQQKGIVAEFEYLNWIEPIAGLDERVKNQAAEEAAAAKMPDIHLWSEQFSYADIPLGELRMEVRNVADGIKVEQLSLKSALAEINVSGSWNKFATGLGKSTFNIVMFSERIADFLHTVGFKAPISNAQTLIEMQAEWQGVPSQFNMADIDGQLAIKIGQGQVLDQDPGFGRVLGLFNLTNLPRRLILDFRDVLADGLLFRSMEGNFIIESGVAKTDDFLIKASSAKIYIKGDVGFADQSYDQIITIRPQIGKTFPTIGAIAGGPVGAAAGFLVQGLLDKQLKSSNEIIYQVSGTWDDPLIELIDKAMPETTENTGNNNEEG